MLTEAHCVLSETEGNAKLIHYVRGDVLFPGKGCFNKAGGSAPGQTCLCRKLGNPLPGKLGSGVCCLRRLIVILVCGPTPGHII